jgi:hypothetical protein
LTPGIKQKTTSVCILPWDTRAGKVGRKKNFFLGKNDNGKKYPPKIAHLENHPGSDGLDDGRGAAFFSRLNVLKSRLKLSISCIANYFLIILSVNSNY